MGSIPNPSELNGSTPSFEEFQRQASLMTSCTLLWKELSDHFTSLEQDLQRKSEALKLNFQSLDMQTKASLVNLKKREVTIDGSVEIALEKLGDNKLAALRALGGDDHPDGEVIDGGDMLLRSHCRKMESQEFWNSVVSRGKEIDVLRKEIPTALAECIDPAKFVIEALSEVFPVDKRKDEKEKSDLAWACVLILESLIPVVVDPVIGRSRLMVTPSVKEKAEDIAETWKKNLKERGGLENVKTPDVHTFLQHLVTFGIGKKEDMILYRKLVVGSVGCKQLPKLAVSLGLQDDLPDMIQELINKGQILDAVRFSFEAGLKERFPPIPLLKTFLRDEKKAACAITESHDNPCRAAMATRREETAIRTVMKCIEELKLEAEFPLENLRKRLEQLEKPKAEKRKPVSVPANKRTRACTNAPMPPAKAGRMNAYASFVRSPSHTPFASYPSSPTPYPSAYSPEAVSPIPLTYPPAPYSFYGYGYGNSFAPPYQPPYCR